MFEKFITKQKSGYANFICEKCGYESYAACKDGDVLYVGQTLKIILSARILKTKQGSRSINIR